MDTRTYVSDNLIKLVGGSEDMMIDFVLQTAKTAKSPTLLFDKLSVMLESGDAELRRFSEDLFSRVTKPSNGSSAPQNAKPKQVRKKYALVDMPEEEEVPVQESRADGEKDRKSRHRHEKDRRRSRSRERSSKKSRRRRDGDFDDRWGDEEAGEEEEEEFATPPPKRARFDDKSASPDRKERTPEPEEDAEERDRRERKEFEHRLRNKDADSTKKLVDDKSSKQEQADAERRAQAGKLSAEELKAVRLRSRQDYLQ
jgi:pre-mRNA-splicing factor ATP-dependent RNA helicase DHX16